MADQTQGAIDALLRLLATAIGDEARLLSGLPGNMQFIKDEMDSMNGFLMHLTKTESEHDDQIRAWMKQVREIAYVAEDCVERYVRDISPHDRGGILEAVVFLICHPKKYWLRHRLAKQILELKVRVNDVGERRNRYGVQVPTGSELTKAEEGGAGEKRDAFRSDLEQGIADCSRQAQAQKQQEAAPGRSAMIYSSIRTAVRRLLPAAVPSFISKAISQLPAHVRPQGATVVRGTLKKCSDDDDEATTFRCIEMLLCALYAYPYKGSNLELEKLSRKLLEEEAGAEDIKRQAMVFCYSLLSTNQKSCLQYLTAFQEETAISRTSLVRRWVAEGLVGNEPGRTPQETGERYFKELLFRGFIRRARVGDADTVKSCEPLSGPISDFISSIARSENFVAVELPVHLDRQLKIRQMVRRSRPQQPAHQAAAAAAYRRRCWAACCSTNDDAVVDPDPMDELDKFLRRLPALYRLNVLDLGGCKGLKPSHVETICTVACLKYLCLRNSDVSRLPPRHMEKLKMLETLDIRQTRVYPGDVRRMYLQSLKHLLAGRYTDKQSGEDVPTARTAADLSVDTVKIPAKIGAMRNMETLSHVQLSDYDPLHLGLGGVAKLHHLRKLGLVIHRANDRAAQQLLAVICKLAASLRSLSIWVTQAGFLDISVLQEATPSLVLENLDINGRISSSSLPSWVEMAGKLANISLRETEMNGGETLRRLANVQSLRCLKLRRRSFIEQALVFRDVHFRALKFLVVDGDTITSLAFTADAAPELHKIIWAISKVHSGELISGINHLPQLKEIEIRGNFNVNNLLQAIGPRAEPPASAIRYRCRFVYLSNFNEITVVKKTKSDTATTLSLPVGVINQQH